MPPLLLIFVLVLVADTVFGSHALLLALSLVAATFGPVIVGGALTALLAYGIIYGIEALLVRRAAKQANHRGP